MPENLSFSELCNWLDWAFDNEEWETAKIIRDEITTRLAKAEFGSD